MTFSLTAYANQPGLDSEEAALIKTMTGNIEKLKSRNQLRTLYLDGERSLRRAGKLGVTMPPQLGQLETVIGWPAKAIEVLDNRLELEGFVNQDASDLREDIAQVIKENHLIAEAPQAHVASMTHGVSFNTISEGGDGEPEVVIRTRPATEATAIWDPRARRVAAGLTLNKGYTTEKPSITLWMRDRTLTLTMNGNRVEGVRTPHTLGRAPMVMMPYRPSLSRPYGVSRISRPLMDLTDGAARTVTRMEATAEAFSFPRIWATGVEKEDFEEETFKIYLNRLLALGADEEGNHPKLGEFAAASPEPHIALLRSLATMAAGEMSVPVNELGIIHDNPSSADAIRAAESSLVKLAERVIGVYAYAWEETVRMVQLTLDGRPDPALLGIKAKFRNPATPTSAAAAQSVMSLISVGALPAQDRITWELLGYDETTILRLEAARNRQQGLSVLAGVEASPIGNSEEVARLTAESTRAITTNSPGDGTSDMEQA